jgi:hypothetical protein
VSRTVLTVLLVAVVAFVAAALLAGDAIWTIPVLILFGIVAVGFGGHLLLRKRVEQTDGRTTLPASHVEADDGTDLGDTEQAHDAVSPHDLPHDHPGRLEAERQARFAQGAEVTEGSR